MSKKKFYVIKSTSLISGEVRISPCTYPAYEYAYAGLQSFNELNKENFNFIFEILTYEY